MKEKSVFCSLIALCVFSVSAIVACRKKEGGEKRAAEREPKEIADKRGEIEQDFVDGFDTGEEKFVPGFPDIEGVEVEPDGRKVDLRLNLKKGQVIRMRMINEQKIHQVIQGMEQSMDQVIGMGITLDVKDVDDDGNAGIYASYHWIKFTQEGGPVSIVYDSDDPPAEIHPSAKMLAALKGNGFMMRVNPLGKVLSIKGAEEMLKNAMEKADLPPGPETDAIKQNLAQQFSDEALKKNWENMMAFYPDEPVGVGGRWNIKGEGAGAFSMTLYNAYVMEKLEKDTAVLRVESTLITGGNGEPIRVGAMEMKHSLKGRQRGTIHLDLETGFTRSAEMTQNISGTIEMDVGGGKIIKWPIKIKTKVKMIPEPEK